MRKLLIALCACAAMFPAVASAGGVIVEMTQAGKRQQFIDGLVNASHSDRMGLPMFVYANEVCKIDVPEELLAAAHELERKYPADYRKSLDEVRELTLNAFAAPMLCQTLQVSVFDARQLLKDIYSSKKSVEFVK